MHAKMRGKVDAAIEHKHGTELRVVPEPKKKKKEWGGPKIRRRRRIFIFPLSLHFVLLAVDAERGHARGAVEHGVAALFCLQPALAVHSLRLGSAVGRWQKKKEKKKEKKKTRRKKLLTITIRKLTTHKTDVPAGDDIVTSSTTKRNQYCGKQ